MKSPYETFTHTDVHQYGTYTNMGCSPIWHIHPAILVVHPYGTFIKMNGHPYWRFKQFKMITHMGQAPIQEVHPYGTFAHTGRSHMGCSPIQMLTHTQIHSLGPSIIWDIHLYICSSIWDVHPYSKFTHMGRSPIQDVQPYGTFT